MRGPAGIPIGQLRRVLISNIVVSLPNTRQAAIITGIPGHEIEDVRFRDIQLLVPGGGTKEDAATQPPENENGYPEPNRFGPMPAYGFFVRHVKGIELRDVEIQCAQPDARPAFVLDEVDGAEFTHVKSPRGPGATWSLTNVKDFAVTQSRPFLDSYFESIQQKTL
jgi:hypothetical protein